MSDPLRIIAKSAQDVPILSASLQDAIVKVGEINFDQGQRALTLRLSRFAHETDEQGQRTLCGLQIHDVLGLSSKNINRADPHAFMVLLSCEFTPHAKKFKKGPGGELLLNFAGDGILRLSLDSVDLILADIAPSRTTSAIPDHDRA